MVPSNSQRSKKTAFWISIQPVFHSQPRNPCEVREIAGEQQGIVGQTDGGNLQVHRADAQTLAPEILKKSGGFAIERKNIPFSQNFDVPLKPRIELDLLARPRRAVQEGKPAPGNLLNSDDGSKYVRLAS